MQRNALLHLTAVKVERLLRHQEESGEYSASTHDDICSNDGRRNGNRNGCLKWILSSKWKGWSYNILGWHVVWMLLKLWWRQSGIRTQLKMKEPGSGRGMNLLLCFIGSAPGSFLETRHRKEKNLWGHLMDALRVSASLFSLRLSEVFYSGNFERI